MLSLSELSSSTATTLSSDRRKRRQRRRTRRPPYHSSPSSGLLSLLATVVSSTLVNAGPVVLPFLCPGVEDKFLYPKREESFSGTDNAKSARAKGRKRRLPDRYVRGSDGLWRKTDWNLYGSTMCADCQASTSSTSMPTADADDTVNTGAASSTTTTSTTAASTTSLDDFMNSLPPGWKPLTDSDHTAMILTISLSLAFFICIVMILCVIWRRGKKRSNDPEKRARRKNTNSGDDLQVMIEKELKTKKKVLARATARWKANARYTFRQRRGKRKIVHHLDSDTDVTPTNITQVQSSLSSPAHSRRSSIDSILTRNSDSFVDQVPGSSGERPSPLTYPISSPPAYLHHPLSTNNHNLMPSGKITPTTPSHRASVLSLTPSTLSIDQPVPYTSSSHHMAHVATDDKALLERLNQLVSAPDASRLLNSHDTSTVAPVWQDEELSDFTELGGIRPESTSSIETVNDSSHGYFHPSHNGGIMMFPPPPILSLSPNEKGKGTQVYPHEYPYHPDRSFGSSFEYEQDILDVEPEAGPSAPPFEANIGTSDPSPSAPPLEPSEIFIPEHPSAPYSPTSDEADGDSAVVESDMVEAHGQSLFTTEELAGLSEDSIRASRACVSVVSPEEPDGLFASNNVRDTHGRTFGSSSNWS
ncbi:hypothetical protein J3R30DRAFT_1397546 [Lentinula aciculospora]|uniref:Uncharacterized protein n=1 Tax=Lentinula aciculospora TaxID=153920 RepID=A0A9W9ANB8_9AGAR|nr:hypothetical protein J3R30DRAFT_1397546 [Lentinula aciculospora]